MTADPVLWTFALAPDVIVDPGDGGAFLRTPTSRTWIEAGSRGALDRLAGAGASEAEIRDRLEPDEAGAGETRCGALLYQLESQGLLARSVHSRGRRLASCIPRRPPPEPLTDRPPHGLLRLSRRAFARAGADAVVLETPISWGSVTVHDRDLLPLLHDLAVGRRADDMAAASPAHSEEAVLAFLALVSWCHLLDGSDDDGWSAHELLFHARSRRGYARVLLGKIDPAGHPDVPGARTSTSTGTSGLALAPPDLARLLADDAPYAMVAERRRSARRQGAVPITSAQLSEFLFRTLHERGGRRPYPSGGGCYPLNGYLAVRQCLGVAPGLYGYDPVRHELLRVAGPGPGLDDLLTDAAGAANMERPPQVLLVLAAEYARTQRVYGELSYSLILKEVGAVFQAGMMAAAAMGLGTCPLGCGNAALLSEIVGVSPLVEASVGEMIVGSLDEEALSAVLQTPVV